MDDYPVITYDYSSAGDEPMREDRPKQRRLSQYDEDTGEVLQGVLVLVGQRRAHPYGRRWVMTNQDALTSIASDPELSGETLRVFLYLNGRLDFENLIQVPQTEIANDLGMQKQNVYRSLKQLEAKKIILRGPKVGHSSTFRLNPHFGWKGKVHHLRRAQEGHLRSIQGGKGQKPLPLSGE
jgi:hypothetical protein